jgi:predicted SprT family Zn-dependent metalloprotease
MTDDDMPEWKKRLKRMDEATKRASGEKTPLGKRRLAAGRKYRCAMCGKRLSKRMRQETTTDTGLPYCKKCAKFREGKITGPSKRNINWTESRRLSRGRKQR